jgi:hypothetical protein
MQATLPTLAELGTRLGTNGGDTLAGAPLGRIVGHPSGKCVRTRVDWPENDVQFPVEILVRNRSGLAVKLPSSIIWTRQSQTIRTSRRQVLVKQLLRKRLRALEVRQTRVRRPVPTTRSAAAVRQPRPSAQPRLTSRSRIAML